MTTKPYTCVDDHVVMANCLYCGRNDKFYKPFYTFCDEHTAFMELNCNACNQKSYVAFCWEKGRLELCFRTEAIG